MSISLTAPAKAYLCIVLLALVTFSGLSLAGANAAENAAAPAAPDQSAGVLTAEEAIDQITSPDGVLQFDVAEDMGRFAFSPAPVHEDGLPAYGNAFITQGYIYPHGLLNGTNGVNPDGSPEFPEQVLGEWTCRGFFVGDGAHTTTGAMVITTQVFRFGTDLLDAATLIAEGYELADVEIPIARAITGGTGQFSGAAGEGEQTLLGLNATEGFNLRFEFQPQG